MIKGNFNVYNYDVRDRLISRVDPDGKTIGYTYDVAGNRTSVTIPSGTTSYTFDPLNRIDLVTNGTDITDYNYDAVGNLSQTTLPNGVIETRSYDPLNRLVKLESKKDTTVLSGFTYSLNPSGMRTSVTEQDGRKVDYKYDSLYRLTEEKITDVTNGNRTVGYVMDKVGNRTSKSDSVDGTTSYVYDNNDRLLSETTNGQTKTYTYDAKGNTISESKAPNDKTDYTWDDKGRLIKAVITSPTGVSMVEYIYNENNIRVSQKVDGVETRFLLDSNRDYAQVLEEYNPVNGTVLASYVYGWDLISQNRGGVKSFYIYDGLGSVRALTNASGVVTDRYNYEAYGTLLNSSGSSTNNYRFTGEQFDPNLKDYYLRDRYYGTDIGRFTRSDTWEAIQPGIAINKYLYGDSNPSNLIDPSGLFSILDQNVAFNIIGTLAVIAFETFLPRIVSSFFTREMNLSDDVIIYVGWGREFPTTKPFGHSFIAVDGFVYSYPGTPIPQLNIPPQAVEEYTNDEIARYGYNYTKYSISYSISEKQQLKTKLNLLKQSPYTLGNYVTGFPGQDARNCTTYVADSLVSKSGIFDVLIKGVVMPYGLAWGLDIISVLNGSLVKKLVD